MLAECPWCGKRFETARGGRQHCPHCRAEIELPDTQPSPEPSTPPSAAGSREASEAPTYGPWEQTSSVPASTSWVESGRDEAPHPSSDREEPSAPLAPAPWERGEGSLWHSFVQTWKGAALHPNPFFRNLGPYPSLWPAFGFAFLIGTLVALFDSIWGWVGVPLHPAAWFPTDPGSLDVWGPAGLVGAIVGNAILIWLGAGILHLCLTILRAGSQGFATTFRTFCYASAPLLVGIFPGAGFIGSIWSLAVLAIGLRWTQRTSVRTALAAISLPYLVLFVLAIAAFLTFALALG